MGEAKENGDSIAALDGQIAEAERLLEDAIASGLTRNVVTQREDKLQALQHERERLIAAQDKPPGVPERIWQEYEAYKQSMELERERFIFLTPEAMEAMTRLVKAPDCKAVLEIISGRILVNAPTFVAFGVPWTFRPAPNPLLLLAMIILEAKKGAPPADNMAQGEREKEGAEIAELAARLRDKLIATLGITPAGYGAFYPVEFRRSLAGAAASHLDMLKALPERMPADWPRAEIHWGDMKVAVDSTVRDCIPGILAAVERGAREWAESPAPLGRPNSKDAKRLYFMRALAEWFREHYRLRGSELDECVFAITKAILGADGLTVRAVSQAINPKPTT